MVTVGKKLYQYDAHIEQTLILEVCGLRLVIPREVITSIESVYKVAAQGLWGADNKFEFNKLKVAHLSVPCVIYQYPVPLSSTNQLLLS